MPLRSPVVQTGGAAATTARFDHVRATSTTFTYAAAQRACQLGGEPGRPQPLVVTNGGILTNVTLDGTGPQQRQPPGHAELCLNRQRLGQSDAEGTLRLGTPTAARMAVSFVDAGANIDAPAP